MDEYSDHVIEIQLSPDLPTTWRLISRSTSDLARTVLREHGRSDPPTVDEIGNLRHSGQNWVLK